jgi:hypothetical protein
MALPRWTSPPAVSLNPGHSACAVDVTCAQALLDASLVLVAASVRGVITSGCSELFGNAPLPGFRCRKPGDARMASFWAVGVALEGRRLV